MALGPNERRGEEEEYEPWDIGESHFRLAVSPGGYEEKETRGHAASEEERQRSEKRRRPEERHGPEEYQA